MIKVETNNGKHSWKTSMWIVKICIDQSVGPQKPLKDKHSERVSWKGACELCENDSICKKDLMEHEKTHTGENHEILKLVSILNDYSLLWAVLFLLLLNSRMKQPMENIYERLPCEMC